MGCTQSAESSTAAVQQPSRAPSFAAVRPKPPLHPASKPSFKKRPSTSRASSLESVGKEQPTFDDLDAMLGISQRVPSVASVRASFSRPSPYHSCETLSPPAPSTRRSAASALLNLDSALGLSPAPSPCSSPAPLRPSSAAASGERGGSPDLSSRSRRDERMARALASSRASTRASATRASRRHSAAGLESPAGRRASAAAEGYVLDFGGELPEVVAARRTDHGAELAED